MTSDEQLQQRMTEMYRAGDLPWDDQLPPPELIALAARLPAGRALDLGCGYGRTAIYLAQLGWHAVGVDFVPAAIAEAKLRAVNAGVSPAFYLADVTQLGFLSPPYDLIVDVGCLHTLQGAALIAYRNQIMRLLADAGIFLLYARLQEGNDPDDFQNAPRGIPETTLTQLFEPDFSLDKIEYGELVIDGERRGGSAWLTYHRKEK